VKDVSRGRSGSLCIYAASDVVEGDRVETDDITAVSSLDWSHKREKKRSRLEQISHGEKPLAPSQVIWPSLQARRAEIAREMRFLPQMMSQDSAPR
jgi:hypothetical protein